MPMISSTKPIFIHPYNFRMKFSISDHCVFPCCRLPTRHWFWFYPTQLFSLHDKHTTLCDEKIYTRLSLLERFPPPLSLISSFLQGSVLKQNTSLMQKIRNSCLSYFSTRFQAVLDSNRPIHIVIIKIYAKHVEAKQNNANKFHLTT